MGASAAEGPSGEPGRVAGGLAGRNLADLVATAARRDPEHPAVVETTTGVVRSWGQVEAAVDAEAHRLTTAGVVAGDRVAMRLTSSAAYCVAMFGAVRAGAVLVPLGPDSAGRELDVVLDHSGARVLVADPGDDTAAEAAQRAGIRRLDPPETTARGEPFAPVGRGEDLAVLGYTSSTSGGPRGAMLPHRALLSNLAQCAALRPPPVTPADRVLLALPLFHVYGLGPGLLQATHAAATVVLADRFDAEQSLRAVAEHRVTTVVGVPQMYRAWLRLGSAVLRESLVTVRLFTSGAAPLEPAVLIGMREATGLDVYEGYGLTESGPVLTTTLVGGRGKPRSVGRALPGAPEHGVAGVELRLVDAEGVPLPPEGGDGGGEDDWDFELPDTGVVSARGPNVFLGYWPDAMDGPDADGWIRTGDVGFFDADGDLHLVDRANDLIIVSGFNVYPHEVEEVLCEHPGVAEAAAVGVPDEHTGEAVCAVLVPAAGAQLVAKELIEHCARRLARFKVPAAVAVVDELPHTPTGKLARRLLRRDLAAAGTHRG